MSLRAHLTFTSSSVVALLGFAGQAAAQPHGALEVNLGSQLSSQSFIQGGAFPELLEEATFGVAHAPSKNVFFDVGGRAFLGSQLNVGVQLSFFHTEYSAPIEGAIPHPFFFETFRPVSGQVGALERGELGLHPNVGWAVPASPRVTVTVFGGPSFFRVQQDLVSGIEYTDSYPFDEAELTGTSTLRIQDWATGFHAGVDVTFQLSGGFGVGGMLRYSRASLDTAADADDPSSSLDVGGLQAGGGIRVAF